MENKEKYTCNFCNTEIEWEGSHHTQGIIWECEQCGKSVCSKCMEDVLGRPLNESDDILCPDCRK